MTQHFVSWPVLRSAKAVLNAHVSRCRGVPEGLFLRHLTWLGKLTLRGHVSRKQLWRTCGGQVTDLTTRLHCYAAPYPVSCIDRTPPTDLL